MALTLTDIEKLFGQKGHEQYTGEPVTQLQHALQSGFLGEQAGASDELVTAAFLHDLGHMLHDLGETPSIHGVDDVHQYRVLPFLRGLFPDSVINAIQRHVDAKRYLCATRPEYHDSLSDDSKRSLKLQGGIFSEGEAAAFIAEDGAKDAVQLRLWDDLAKQPDLQTPGLSHYMQIARRCALRD
jgi:phosphonate degradation associated HDIG domain protein